MRARHPRLWLMTDERMGERLWDALETLPRGSGVVFRHHALPKAQRRVMAKRVAAVARRRRLTLLLAGEPLGIRADGVHGAVARRGRPGLLSRPVHSVPEVIEAARAGADIVFVSPVFATRSHPGARPLGAVRLGLLLRNVRTPAIALGGMDATRFRALTGLGLSGWAAIDAWTAPKRQKRNAVPI